MPRTTLALKFGLYSPAVIGPLLWLWQDWGTWAWWQRVWRLAVLVGAGGGAYAATLWLQGIRARDLRGH